MEIDSEPLEESTDVPRHERFLSVVPWRNSEEFHKVYKFLYSPSISDKRWAVDQISVWETRCHPALPTAIEATVVIVRAVIQDMLYEAEKTFCQGIDIQMLYSMALVRFVNLTLEIDQKAQNKIKMSVLADKRNIPSWIIELRHEATHSFLPSLPVLRMGADRALQYLEESFWKIESANIRPIVKTRSGVEDAVIELMTKYRNIQFFNAEKTTSSPKLLKDLAEIVKEIRLLVRIHQQNFVDTFIQSGIFLSAKDLIRLLQSTDKIFLEEDDCLTLPDKLETFWIPLFKILHQSDLIPHFLEVLLHSQENCTNRLSQKTAVVWGMHILNATKPHAVSELSRCFKVKGMLLYLHRLLFASMKGKNKFTLHLFNMIVNMLGNPERYSQLYCIMALYQGMLLPKDVKKSQVKQPNKDAIVFTVEDLEADFNEEMRKKERSSKKENIWSLAPVSMDFASMPLGAIINPVVPEEKGEESISEVNMDTSFQERFILINENDNEESTVEVKSTSDTNIFQNPEIGDMVYRRKNK